jgi:hypothetical protein
MSPAYEALREAAKVGGGKLRSYDRKFKSVRRAARSRCTLQSAAGSRMILPLVLARRRV